MGQGNVVAGVNAMLSAIKRLMFLKSVLGGALPDGYQKLRGITFSSNTYYEITGFKLRGSDTVRFKASFDKACNVFGCYTTASANDNYSLYMSTTANSKYLRYADGTYSSWVTSAQYGELFDIAITPTGSRGMPNKNDSWSAADFTTSVDMCICTTSTGASSAKLDGDLIGDFIVDGRFRGIPCKRLSDGKIGYYDTYSKTFYPPVGTNPTAIE